MLGWARFSAGGYLACGVGSHSRSMTDRERQLEAEVAWLRYGPEQMNLALRERNAVWIHRDEEEAGEDGDEEKEDKPEFNHVIVCGCKQCLASHRFGNAEPDNIFSAFDDDEERECIVKKCLKYHCEKAGLVVVECAAMEAPSFLDESHILLMDLPTGTWTVGYGKLLDSELIHENPGFNSLTSVFRTINKHHFPKIDISTTTDEGGFFADGSGTDYVAVARRRGFMHEGGETGAEYKARRASQQKE